MSERDLKRIEVLTEILAGLRTVESGAAVMSLAWRPTFRLLARLRSWAALRSSFSSLGEAPYRALKPR